MAFFSDGTRQYFSLSLDPTGSETAYVFSITPRQLSTVGKTLPPCLAISTIAILGLLLIFGFWPPVEGAISDRRTNIILGLSFLSGTMAFLELGFFLWFKTRPNALISDRDRQSIPSLNLLKRLSSNTYLLFLLAIAAPILGIVCLNADFSGAIEEFRNTNTVERIVVIQVTAVLILLASFIVIRLRKIERAPS